MHREDHFSCSNNKFSIIWKESSALDYFLRMKGIIINCTNQEDMPKVVDVLVFSHSFIEQGFQGAGRILSFRCPCRILSLRCLCRILPLRYPCRILSLRYPCSILPRSLRILPLRCPYRIFKDSIRILTRAAGLIEQYSYLKWSHPFWFN